MSDEPKKVMSYGTRALIWAPASLGGSYFFGYNVDQTATAFIFSMLVMTLFYWLDASRYNKKVEAYRAENQKLSGRRVRSDNHAPVQSHPKMVKGKGSRFFVKSSQIKR